MELVPVSKIQNNPKRNPKQSLNFFCLFQQSWGKERPELSAFSRIICEGEDKALQVMEDTAANLSIRIECLCFDGLVLDYTDVADAEKVDEQFHRDVAKNLETRLGYKVDIAEKPWVVEPVVDNGEGEDISDIDSDEEDTLNEETLPDTLPGSQQCSGAIRSIQIQTFRSWNRI